MRIKGNPALSALLYRWGLGAAIVFVILLVVIYFNEKLDEKSSGLDIRIGDVFAHANPGQTENPYKKNVPFVSLYIVEEIKDGKTRIKWRTMWLTGNILEYETWQDTKDFKYDQKIKEGGKRE